MEASARPTCHVQRIHNPLLTGPALLLMPEGLLVRWPARKSHPPIGSGYSGRTIEVPANLRETVLTLLFGENAFARCDAAKRLAETKASRQHILLRVFSRSYIQQLLASAIRIPAEERAALEENGRPVSVYCLIRRAYRRRPANDNATAKKSR